MRPRLVAVAALVALLAGTGPALARADGDHQPRLEVGAARIDISPPPFDDRADALAFPNCPAALFDGARQFAFEEPYRDVQGAGHFEYPDPFCDANHNGRWDGIYISGGVDHVAQQVHDAIDARAVAFSDGEHAAVIVSVVAQGIHETYTHRVRDRVRALRPGITDVIVSANHNESSPDTVGIYGAPDVAGQGVAGGRSGIDDYYLSFLVDRVADAAVAAYDGRKPAVVTATQFPVPTNVEVHLSKNFPTTDDQGNGVAVDPKVGVVSARGLDGTPIVNLMSMAAHNQEIGHSGPLAGDISSDWPGYFHRRLEQDGGGMAMFLVGDNGSIEDPQTVPPVPASAGDGCPDGCYAQAQATGEALADAVAAQLPNARPLRTGTVSIRRSEFFVPLENNLFRAAAAAGLFGDRQTYIAGVPAGTAGTELRTEVGVVDVGPDLQLLANPGEAFPALIVGSHWGIEDASCPTRSNPPVPTWHAHARVRLQVGLADDLIGYLIPAWGFATQPGAFTTTCVTDQSDKDQRGHQHKLETESVGPTVANTVAQQLTTLLDDEPQPGTEVLPGRFIQPDGSLTRSPIGAVGIWVDDGTPDGLVVARDGVAGFGDRRVDRSGVFVDYDAAAQSAADLLTHGMTARRHHWFVDVYPDVSGPALGGAHS